MKTIASIFLLTSIFFTENAFALESATGKVLGMETTYMPNSVKFWIDQATTSCAAGKVLVWNRGVDNNKATYAAILTAISADKNVTVILNNGDTTCAIQYFYINN